MDETVAQFAQFSEPVRAWVNGVLMYVGFGTTIGLLAKAIMPGRDPGGAVATLAMGIGGAIIGCGTYALVTGQRVALVSPIGLLAATAGAFSLLFFYRLLGGYWFIEGEVAEYRTPRRRRPPRPRHRLRRREYAHADYYCDDG